MIIMIKNQALKVINIVKLSIFITWCWPLSKDAVKFKVVCVSLYHYLCMILSFGLTLGLLNTFRNHLDDSLIMTNALTLACPTVHVICNIVSCKVYSYHLQLVIYKMENFFELLKPQEEPIIEQYINKCNHFYGAAIFWLYSTAFILISGPVILDQAFPLNVEYPFPFDIYQQPLKSIVYVHQSFICLQVCSHLCMNVFMSMLLWFTSARFELLSEELRTIVDINDLMKCVRKHQKLLKYAEDVITIVRPFALSTITLSTIALIIDGLILIIEQPLSMKIQSIALTFGALTEVFMYTWPAEHLIHVSNEVAQAIYDTQWYDQSIQLRKSLQIIMLRAQKSVVIAIPCVMPILSLNYYTSYLSTIFSYFTTLRVFMQNEK